MLHLVIYLRVADNRTSSRSATLITTSIQYNFITSAGSVRFWSARKFGYTSVSAASVFQRLISYATVTYSAGGCETEIDFVLVGEKYTKYVRDVKVIPWQLQHRLVVVDLDKKVLKNGCEKATDHKKKNFEVQ